MSSSSPIKHDASLSNQLSRRLLDLRSRCIKYQCHLIERILENPKNRTTDLTSILDDPNYNKEDIFILLHVLRHERSIAGNLAGKLIIELHADRWSIAETDFLKKLTNEDKTIIKQKLLSKRNFLEAEIREILQDLLITKFELLLKIRK